jgi:hypothetical protein
MGDILIRWIGDELKGFTDVFTDDMLRRSSDRSEHVVLDPVGNLYGTARCRVTVAARNIEFDYSAFANVNIQRAMEPGIMRLVFSDSSRRTPIRVDWREPDRRGFAEAKAIVLPPSAAVLLFSSAEGDASERTVTRYSRDARLRRLCVERFGAKCWVCAFDFEASYGNIGAGFIHVHHMTPLAKSQPRQTHALRDLRPVCPNCHAMLHRAAELGVEGLKRLVQDRREHQYPSGA